VLASAHADPGSQSDIPTGNKASDRDLLAMIRIILPRAEGEATTMQRSVDSGRGHFPVRLNPCRGFSD
jgi:hypothetical protein